MILFNNFWIVRYPNKTCQHIVYGDNIGLNEVMPVWLNS